MGGEAQPFYEFGSFRLDPGRRTLMCNGELVALAPKALDTLLFLIQNSGRVVEKDELMKALWPDSFVEEGNLTQNIFMLRKTLGDENGSSFIKTIPRRGYKFVASVRLLDIPAHVAQSSLPAEYWRGHSPFRSLQVFEQEDAWLFFGRNSETEELLLRLGRSPILVVTGNSGCGKSSLVRAGLIPALRKSGFRKGGESSDSSTLPHPTSTGAEGHDSSTVLHARKTGVEGVDSWRVAIIRPAASPFDYLAEVLPSQLAPELDLGKQAEFIANCRSRLPLGGDTLRDAIAALANGTTQPSSQTRTLLVVDQFEELFTLTTNRQIRERYIDALLAASQREGSVPVHLILILRADFYSHCLEHPGLSRCLETNLYNVPRMTHEQLRQSIEKRLALAGAHAESGLIDSLLDDIGAEPGNLALLEHALGQLWEKCGGFGRALTNEAYAAMGRLRGALGRHADEVYDSIGDEKQKQLTKRIFLELVHLGDGAQETRRRVRKSDLLSFCAAEDLEPLLAKLISSRLVSSGMEGGETFVEVSHEALIREWPALCEWLAQNREELKLERRLNQAAKEWEELGRDVGALLQGARLVQAEEWLDRYPDAPSNLKQFVSASGDARIDTQARELAHQRELARQAEANAQTERKLGEQQAAAAMQARRSALRVRWFSYGLACLLFVALGATWFARRQQLLAQSRMLAVQSEEMLTRDYGRALNLAIQGWNTAKNKETYVAVTKALPQTLNVLNHDDEVITSVFSPDGQLILTASHDHTARIWDASNGQLVTTLSGHTDKVPWAAFSPDGRQIVTASSDHTARVWDASTGSLLATLRGHTGPVNKAVFSPDGQRVVTASDDHTARIWNAADGRLLAILQGHTQEVWCATFSPNGHWVATASLDNTARIWNSADGHLLTVLRGHNNWVHHCEFSPDGQRIVTISLDYTARLWSTTDGRLLATLHHDNAVSYAEFSPNGQWLVTSSLDQSAKIWNVYDGRLLVVLKEDSPVRLAEFSPDGQLVLTANDNHTARIWNTVDGRLLATLQGHTAPLMHAAFSPDGKHIVTGSRDHTARIWSLVGVRSLLMLGGHTDAISHARFSPDGHRIVTANPDHTAKIWNAEDGRLLATLQGHTDAVTVAKFSPDSQRIVTASDDHTARVWNAEDGHLLATLQGHTDAVTASSFSPDSQRIVTASNDHTALVWNAGDGRLLATLHGHTDKIWAAAFSPNGQRIVTASYDRTARIWNARDGRLLATLKGHTDAAWDVAFSPDGYRVVTASRDHTAKIWNAEDGHLLATLQGHTDAVTTAVFSPDSQRIVTASCDHTVRVWSTTDGHFLFSLQGHTDSVWAATFSPDGQRILTGSVDHTARLWNAADGHFLASLQGHVDYVRDARFSPDGQRILTASWDQTVRVWQILNLEDIKRILEK